MPIRSKETPRSLWHLKKTQLQPGNEHVDRQDGEGPIQPCSQTLQEMVAQGSHQAQKCENAAIYTMLSEELEDSEDQTALCESCQTFDRVLRIPPRMPDAKKNKTTVIASAISIEVEQCPLCTFFRELRRVQSHIESRHEEARWLYDVHMHQECFLDYEYTAFQIEPHTRSSSMVSDHPRVQAPGMLFASPSTSFTRNPPASINYSEIAEWITTCSKLGHGSTLETCLTGHMPYLPLFQVIDCRSRTVVLWPTDTRPPYVALSYVWGKGNQDCDITEGNLPSTLPLVIEDSITVTLNLGYQYLWVDRYCVPQRGNIAKAVQIRNMNHVYHHSIFTIIAAYGDGPSCGLPGVSKRPRVICPSVTISGVEFNAISRLSSEEFERSVWNTQGWTYQEGMLARRCLVFMEYKVQFQCQYMYRSDGFNQHGDKNLGEFVSFRLKSISEGASKPFFQTVSTFAQRDLSVETDALDAFKGILEEYSELAKNGNGEQMHFYFGVPLFLPMIRYKTIPKSSFSVFLFHLTWRICPPYSNKMLHTGENMRLTAELVKRRKSFPSWSWTGWKIKYPLTFDTAFRQSDTFIYIARMEVESYDSTRFYSENDQERIMELYHRGEISPKLFLMSWVFDLSIQLEELENIRTHVPGKSFSSLNFGPGKEEFYLESGLLLASNTVGELAQAYFMCEKLGYPLSKEDGKVTFKLLVLTAEEDAIEAMLIAQRDSSLSYEKVGMVHIYRKSQNDHFWDYIRRQPGSYSPPCTWQTICLQ